MINGKAAGTVLILTVAFAITFGNAMAEEGKEKGKKEDAPEAKHKSAHGGCLNALGSCENGHAEVKLEGETLKLWFVGGGTDTEKAVRVPDKQIGIDVTPSGSKTKTVFLKAKPNELAEEKEGDCSHFEGSAPWLKGVWKFKAEGVATFKGKAQKIVIEYPNGYDPD